jgi:hypothetical protein
MISFSKLGNYGRLGNQLFQYAFLRCAALRLGTKFHCPRWEGDEIFSLDDDDLRAGVAQGITAHFDQAPEAGFSPRAMAIEDGTEIQGYFQSDTYYKGMQDQVRKWFTFRSDIRDSALRDWAHEHPSECTSVSLRLDNDYANTREFFPLYNLGFYRKALESVASSCPVIVFADRPDLAQSFLSPLRRKLIMTGGLTPKQQLYRMTLCKCNIITNSTFAWWGAWLNQTAGRRVIAPLEWCRPGVRMPIKDINSDEWESRRALWPVWDNFQVYRIRHPLRTLTRVRQKLFSRNDRK